MDVVRSPGAQEQNRAGDVGGLGPPAGRDALEDLLAALGVLAQVEGVGCGHIPGGDRVDVDAQGCPLVGEGLGQARDGRLGGRVPGDVDPALEAEQRRGVDDLAVTALAEDLAGRGVDILINNAGSIRRAPAVDHLDEDFDYVLDLSLIHI